MIYKAERKSMKELNDHSKDLQYDLKEFGISCEFHGGFWATHVYLLQNDEPVCRILDNGVLYQDKSWYGKLTEKERYLVNEFIDYVMKYI